MTSATLESDRSAEATTPAEAEFVTTVAQLAAITGTKMLPIMRELMRSGISVTVNQPFDALPFLLTIVKERFTPAEEGEPPAIKAPPTPQMLLDWADRNHIRGLGAGLQDVDRLRLAYEDAASLVDAPRGDTELGQDEPR